jgi:hypothetical protein
MTRPIPPARCRRPRGARLPTLPFDAGGSLRRPEGHGGRLGPLRSRSCGPARFKKREKISQVPVAERVRRRARGRWRKRPLLRPLRRALTSRRAGASQPRGDQIGVGAFELAWTHRQTAVREAIVTDARIDTVRHCRALRSHPLPWGWTGAQAGPGCRLDSRTIRADGGGCPDEES